MSNITANAVQHTSKGFVKIEVYSAEVQDTRVRVEIIVQDTGRGMSDSQLDALFRELEQVSTEEVNLSEDQPEAVKEKSETLGLGLAVVARIVRNMDGQLRLKSEAGKGSRFVIQLSFEMPPSDSPGSQDGGLPTSVAGSAASVSTTRPPAGDGEVMLVDRGSTSLHKHVLTAKKSFDDNVSLGSHRTGTSLGSAQSSKSDADRLIDAIQTPLGIGEPESETTSVQRRNSKGAYYSGSGSPRHTASRSMSPTRSFGRPGGLLRSVSSPDQNTKEDAAASNDASGGPVGYDFITDTKTPIRPVKIPDEYQDQPEAPAQPSETSGVLFEVSDEASSAKRKAGTSATTIDGNVHRASRPESAKLRVLVAEDDPINMKILRKRLEKAGHTVHHTVNGEDCATAYRESAVEFDVVLMDMQVRFSLSEDARRKHHDAHK